LEIKDDLYYLQDINKEEGPSKSELYNIQLIFSKISILVISYTNKASFSPL
jgi:hypothetical protein